MKKVFKLDITPRCFCSLPGVTIQLNVTGLTQGSFTASMVPSLLFVKRLSSHCVFLTVHGWICSCALCCLIFVDASDFMPVPCFLDYCTRSDQEICHHFVRNGTVKDMLPFTSLKILPLVLIPPFLPLSEAALKVLFLECHYEVWSKIQWTLLLCAIQVKSWCVKTFHCVFIYLNNRFWHHGISGSSPNPNDRER